MNSKSLYLRAAADKFIYQDIPSADQISIDRKARSSNMAIPPHLHTAINLESVQYETLKFLEASKRCSTIEELEDLLNKKSEKPESMKDFNKMLSAFLSVPHKS